MRGEGARCAESLPINKIQTRIKRERPALQPRLGQGEFGIRKVLLRRSANGRRVVIQTIRWRARFPKSARVRGLHLIRCAQKDISTEAICLEGGVFGGKAPRLPFFEGTQGDSLKVGRAEAHATRGIDNAVLQIRILNSLATSRALTVFEPANHFPRENPASAHGRPAQSTLLHRLGDPKAFPCLRSPNFGGAYRIRMFQLLFPR